MNKVELIKEYIAKCENVIDTNNIGEAELIIEDIVSVFENEIVNITRGLTSYELYGDSNYISDVSLLKKKLENYLVNIKEDYEKRKDELEIAKLRQPIVTANANAIQSQSVNFSISITELIKKIDELDNSILDKKEKDQAKDYLYSMEGIKSTKDKGEFWNKAKTVLGFLADKSVDVAIAMLPYITNGLFQ